MVPKKEIKTASWPNLINKSIGFFLLIISCGISVFTRNAYLNLLNQCHRITYLRRVNAFTEFFLCERSKFMASTLLMQMSFHQGVLLLLPVVRVTSSLIYAVFCGHSMVSRQRTIPAECQMRLETHFTHPSAGQFVSTNGQEMQPSWTRQRSWVS